MVPLRGRLTQVYDTDPFPIKLDEAQSPIIGLEKALLPYDQRVGASTVPQLNLVDQVPGLRVKELQLTVRKRPGRQTLRTEPRTGHEVSGKGEGQNHHRRCPLVPEETRHESCCPTIIS
jgi:hypothetical protein